MKIGIIGSSGFIGKNLNFYFNKKSNYKIFNFSSYKKYKNKWVKKICNEIPSGRMAKISDFDGMIIYLLSDLSSYVNGSLISIDGGRAIY